MGPRYLAACAILGAVLVLASGVGAAPARPAPGDSGDGEVIVAPSLHLAAFDVRLRPAGPGFESSPYVVVVRGASDRAVLRFPIEGVARATTYQIEVEGRRWPFAYVGESTVQPRFDKQVEVRLGVGLDVPRVAIPVALALLTLGAAFNRVARRPPHPTAPEAPQAPDVPLEVPEGDLPPLGGRILNTEGGESLRVVRAIGCGSMGAVYEVEGAAGQRWAVKMPFRSAMASPETRGRFLRETQICSRLLHPGLVRVLDWGTCEAADGEWPFMVMELVRGRTLRAHLDDAAGSPLPVARVARWMEQILRALQAVHEAGVVHRDLKPENVIVTDGGVARITDFGVAGRLDRHSVTGTGISLGTPLYMSPEHLEARNTTAASDVYSAGIVLYELLSGSPPFQADNVYTLLTRLLTEAPEPIEARRDGLPPDLAALVNRMISRDPGERPPIDEALGVLASCETA